MGDMAVSRRFTGHMRGANGSKGSVWYKHMAYATYYCKVLPSYHTTYMIHGAKREILIGYPLFHTYNLNTGSGDNEACRKPV